MLRARRVLVLVALSSVGCFYDSTWGARKAAQRHNAVRATPAVIRSPGETSVARATDDRSTVLRVRAHATPAYEALTPDWKSHVAAILAQASTTLEASIGARLELLSADTWNHPAPGPLDADLAALRDEDTGDGTELVMGLVGGLPVATQTFDQLGLSEMHGKHLVVRAPNVASEYDAVEKAFDELTPEYRARLRRERVRHREVAVLLHEIGHALGAAHETSAGSLMRPTYDPTMSTFDETSVAEMRRGLSPVADAGARGGEAASAEVATPGPAPRDDTPSAEVATPAPAAKDDTPSELRGADGAAWRRASDLAKAGDARGAWTAAQPLFARYPLVYGVQDLRCKLAVASLASYADARTECEPLMKITLKGTRAK